MKQKKEPIPGGFHDRPLHVFYERIDDKWRPYPIPRDESAPALIRAIGLAQMQNTQFVERRLSDPNSATSEIVETTEAMQQLGVSLVNIAEGMNPRAALGLKRKKSEKDTLKRDFRLCVEVAEYMRDNKEKGYKLAAAKVARQWRNKGKGSWVPNSAAERAYTHYIKRVRRILPTEGF